MSKKAANSQGKLQYVIQKVELRPLKKAATVTDFWGKQKALYWRTPKFSSCVSGEVRLTCLGTTEDGDLKLKWIIAYHSKSSGPLITLCLLCFLWRALSEATKSILIFQTYCSDLLFRKKRFLWQYYCLDWGIVVYICIYSTWQVEAGGGGLWGQSGLLDRT